MSKNTKPKMAYHHENLKEALIDTSIEMLDEGGYESITLRGVTSRIGSSRTSIYRHFDSKEDLLHAIVLKGFSMLDRVLKPILRDEIDDIPTRFKKMGHAYIGFAIENQDLYRLMMGNSLSDLRESTCTKNSTPVNTGFDSLVSLIREAQRVQVFVDGNAEIQAASIWAIIHGQASLLIDNHLMLQEHRDDIVKETLNVIIRGYFS